jgi:hypothetical protein
MPDDCTPAANEEEVPPTPKRRGRRATTPPPAGSDPHPAPEPPRTSGTENDERMRQDKPPHY